jgi:hypothetical protein
MITQLKKELQEYGEKMATKYANKYFNASSEEDEWQFDFETYQYGFNQAIELMMPSIECLGEIADSPHYSTCSALSSRTTSTINFNALCDCHVSDAKKALADLRKKVWIE